MASLGRNAQTPHAVGTATIRATVTINLLAARKDPVAARCVAFIVIVTTHSVLLPQSPGPLHQT